PDRLKTPLIKENGKFREASWDEALDLVARRFTELKNRFGSDCMGVFSSAKCTNEENYLMQKFARAVLGTNNVDHCARLCHASSVAGLMMSFGSGASTNSFSGIRKTDCILITGSNTAESHPIVGLDVKWAVKYNNAKLIVVDPRKVEMTDYADLWLRQRSGTDVVWINGLANVIISESLYDKKFVEERAEGFEKFAESVKSYNPRKVEEITGIPASALVEAARTYAAAKNAVILWAMGITQHTTATDAVMALANLAMLTGHVGTEYSGVNPLRGQNNVQGSSDMGALPNLYPGYQKAADESIRKKFEEAWKVNLPVSAGLTIVEMMHAAADGKIKGMYIMGENPVLSDPNIPKVKAGLENLEFLVVQDIFLTETAEFADVVLPSASFAEKDGTFTNSERRIQLLNKVLGPIGESKPDWKIICEVSNKMGYNMNYAGADEIMEELAGLTPQYGGVRHSRLKECSLQWPCPDTNHPGTKFLFKDKFPIGRGKFYPIEYKPAAELPDDKYPYLLTTGRILYHYHTGTMTRRVEGLNELRPHGTIEINPEDANIIGCKNGEMVDISSRRGSIKALAEVTERPPKGTVFMTFHFKEAAANILTIDALDPIAKIPEYKVCAVRIKCA
ncbi:MAG: formate dehydrogenase subunit alpha, partial [Candidatus Omnitrophica bacterium]|nr:formate dehydrogenase subunit alpha [Candidatus Omnitrophota bacterium]